MITDIENFKVIMPFLSTPTLITLISDIESIYTNRALDNVIGMAKITMLARELAISRMGRPAYYYAKSKYEKSKEQAESTFVSDNL